jgi:hypothetical protein
MSTCTLAGMTMTNKHEETRRLPNAGSPSQKYLVQNPLTTTSKTKTRLPRRHHLQSKARSRTMKPTAIHSIRLLLAIFVGLSTESNRKPVTIANGGADKTFNDRGRLLSDLVSPCTLDGISTYTVVGTRSCTT